MEIHCALAMLIHDGRILLAKRAPHRRICPNQWDVIGGHLEPGESVEQALRRETLEEVGVMPLRYVPAGTIVYHYPDASERTVRLHVFTVLEWSGGEPRRESDEHTELRWFTFAEAGELEDLAMEEYRGLFIKLSSTGLDATNVIPG